MPETFTPHQPEKRQTVTITSREAVLLEKLRRYAYGEFVVHKAAGLLIRIEIRDSQKIEPKEVELD